MEPVTLAWVAAGVTALFASRIPADNVLDRYFSSWLPAKHRRFQAKLTALHVVATAIIAGGASSLGWEPNADADAFTSAANGVAWALPAVALLRAEFPGLRAGEAAPASRSSNPPPPRWSPTWTPT